MKTSHELLYGQNCSGHFPQLHQKAELTITQFARRFGLALYQISGEFNQPQRPAGTINQIKFGNVTTNQSRTQKHDHRKTITDKRAMSIMKAENSWTTYRTRFLVKAKQLATSFTFTDALGRQHSGRKGDYLVEFSDGILRIASRELFEDIYVPIATDQFQPQPSSAIPVMPLPPPKSLQRRQPLPF